MTIPNNILKQVTTYNDAKLGFLQNYACYLSTFNKQFKDFDKVQKNLGDTVDLELPTRSTVTNGLVATFQATEQRFATLTCDQAANASMAFTAQQFIFQARDYMEKFGMARVAEIGTRIETNLALNNISGVPVYSINSNGQSIPTGALHTESGPYRFYGDGINPINSFGQLAKMEAMFRNYGAVDGPLNVYLDDLAVVDIINSGLGQFVPSRNDKIANSWDLGQYKGSSANYYRSNLLPIHYAGTLGNDGTVLTVVSTNDPTGAAITQITCSGAGTDSDALKSGDLGQFQDGVSGFSNLRYLTFIGHTPSKNPVQIRATANAASSGGNVTFNITPTLQSTPGANQNLTANIVAGMQIKFLPDHRAGLAVCGNGAFMAMPQLPDEDPFKTATKTDMKTGASLRTYYGSAFGQNQKGMVVDAIWAGLIIPEYSMRAIFPV